MADHRSGQCLCGAVKFKVLPKPHDDGMHVDACHCGMCRRQIGGPLLGITLAEAPIIEDDRKLGIYQSSEWAERMFCTVCGSNLFYRMTTGEFYTVHAGTLNDLSDAKLTLEIFVDDKPAYYDFAQDTQKMTGAEVIAAFANNESAS